MPPRLARPADPAPPASGSHWRARWLARLRAGMPGPHPRLVMLMLLLALAWLGYAEWARPRADPAAEATLRALMYKGDRQDGPAVDLAGRSDEELFQVWQAALQASQRRAGKAVFRVVQEDLTYHLSSRVALRDRLLRELIDPALAQPPVSHQGRTLLLIMAAELASESPHLLAAEGQMLIQLLPLLRHDESVAKATERLADRLRLTTWPTLRVPWRPHWELNANQLYQKALAQGWLSYAVRWVTNLPPHHLAEWSGAPQLHDLLQAGQGAAIDEQFWALLGGYSLADKVHWLACQQVRAELRALPQPRTPGEQVDRYRLLRRWLGHLSQMMPAYASQARQWLAAHPDPSALNYTEALVLQRHLPSDDPEMPRLMAHLAKRNPALAQRAEQRGMSHPASRQPWEALGHLQTRLADTTLTALDYGRLNQALSRLASEPASAEQQAVKDALPSLLRAALNDPLSWDRLDWRHFPATWLAAITPDQLSAPLATLKAANESHAKLQEVSFLVYNEMLATLQRRGPPAVRQAVGAGLYQLIVDDQHGLAATLAGSILSETNPYEATWRRAYRQGWYATWCQHLSSRPKSGFDLDAVWAVMPPTWRTECVYLHFAAAMRHRRPDLAPLLSLCDRYLGEVWPADEWASASAQARAAIWHSDQPLLWATLAMAMAPAWALNEPLAAARLAEPHWPARPGVCEEFWLASALLRHWHPEAMRKLADELQFDHRLAAINLADVDVHGKAWDLTRLWPTASRLLITSNETMTPGTPAATASYLEWAERANQATNIGLDIMSYLPPNTLRVEDLLALALSDHALYHRQSQSYNPGALAWKALRLKFMPDQPPHRWRLLNRLRQEGYALPANP